MRSPLAPPVRDRLALLLLSACVLSLLLFLHSRWSWTDWKQPSDIFGDPLEIFARVKLAEEQPGEPFTGFTRLERLGAPFHADWSAYPTPDSVVFFLTGQLARVTGVFAAAKIVAAIFHLLCAVSFYLCARHLRWRVEWAFAGALLFAFSNYNIRWTVTLSFNQTFTLPPLILLCAHAVKTSLPVAGSRGWLLLGGLLGAWLGLGNPYLGCFTGLLAVATLGMALVRRCPWARLAPLVCFLLALAGVFLAANLGYVVQYVTAGDQSPLARNFAGAIIYGLKPIDWIIPPPEHRIDWMSQIGHGYMRQSTVLGDFFPAYLGLVGIAGLTGLLVLACKRLAQRPLRPVPDAVLGLALITAYAVVGGFNSLLALAGLDIFRASQRISIFANIWALFFILRWLQLRLRSLPRLASIGAALVVALAGWWEQTPHFRTAESQQTISTKWQAIQELTRRLESMTGPGAMVFQFPIRQFPEAGPLGDMIDYEHFQPFLAESTLRFSYGPMAHTQELSWQQFVSRLPADEMIAALEASGFSAIWINSRAYADRGDQLIRTLTALQRPEWQHDTPAPIRIVRLKPAATPLLPDLDEIRFQRAWSDQPATGKAPQALALSGWYDLEKAGDRQWRWAREQAEASIWWPGRPPPRARLSFKATALHKDVLKVRHNGKTLLRIPLRPGVIESVTVPFRPASSGDRFTWHIAGDAIYPPSGDARKLGFMIENLGVQALDSGF